MPSGRTRTTRTPAFWDTPRRPMITHTSDSHQIPSKTRQSQSYKFKKIAKNSNFEISQKPLHVTHLLKLLDKMYKYEMDPTRTVGATERTQDAGRTARQTYGRTEWNQYTPQQLGCAGGIIKLHKSLLARETMEELCSHYCACWWPGTIRCQDICKYSDDKVDVLDI